MYVIKASYVPAIMLYYIIGYVARTVFIHGCCSRMFLSCCVVDTYAHSLNVCKSALWRRRAHLLFRPLFPVSRYQKFKRSGLVDALYIIGELANDENITKIENQLIFAVRCHSAIRDFELKLSVTDYSHRRGNGLYLPLWQAPSRVYSSLHIKGAMVDIIQDI